MAIVRQICLARWPHTAPQRGRFVPNNRRVGGLEYTLESISVLLFLFLSNCMFDSPILYIIGEYNLFGCGVEDFRRTIDSDLGHGNSSYVHSSLANTVHCTLRTSSRDGIKEE